MLAKFVLLHNGPVLKLLEKYSCIMDSQLSIVLSCTETSANIVFFAYSATYCLCLNNAIKLKRLPEVQRRKIVYY